ncbi:hypothetical protein [Klebsiella quasipneumoniae]|uniref:hypothetical protein n=1 Tax=Klebsiella quasipneumoniae TaxID=1463165 RepID=UPI00197B1C97|nr:hypothetical protein [Klebsiella quasipneumoniae]MCJ4448658.1 hypothetical protein [Klebsiella quasipneumoniae]QSI12238.1 hypothetical protein FA956_10795 [Klebsiella quasipneumoniae]
MTDITELALITKIKKQLENFDTVVLKEGEAVALVEALEKAQQRIDSQREYYEGVIADGGKRIADLESRTVKMPHRNLGHPKLFLLCPFPYYDAEDMEKALAAAGIRVEAE